MRRLATGLALACFVLRLSAAADFAWATGPPLVGPVDPPDEHH